MIKKRYSARRFFVHEVAIKHQSDECLLWPYGKDSKGYGQITINGKNFGAHRYICLVVHGEPPTEKHHASHSCGNGHLGCVNPNHLGWKTNLENIQDMVAHGRSTRGEKHANAKLTEQQVNEILLLKSIKTQPEIAKQFGVSRSTIGMIHSGRNWSWVE
ncbi:hypothetical protein CN204_04415 [Sinorhizobium meliloti]|uniref:hypothetical protein n=1 Tax=Rhizobium meliloti TaxID=382 RepID=UPI000FD9A23D|nr:hypothetical protein [Sinorhizobium meliloti]RVG08581.1 hypothetical protein CN234_17525 [Sinorhizobium meliloti]RVH87778.1 hypothetical protein CN204_04415 [Sinorhizobium meliloti]